MSSPAATTRPPDTAHDLMSRHGIREIPSQQHPDASLPLDQLLSLSDLAKQLRKSGLVPLLIDDAHDPHQPPGLGVLAMDNQGYLLFGNDHQRTSLQDFCDALDLLEHTAARSANPLHLAVDHTRQLLTATPTPESQLRRTPAPILGQALNCVRAHLDPAVHFTWRVACEVATHLKEAGIALAHGTADVARHTRGHLTKLLAAHRHTPQKVETTYGAQAEFQIGIAHLSAHFDRTTSWEQTQPDQPATATATPPATPLTALTPPSAQTQDLTSAYTTILTDAANLTDAENRFLAQHPEIAALPAEQQTAFFQLAEHITGASSAASPVTQLPDPTDQPPQPSHPRIPAGVPPATAASIVIDREMSAARIRTTIPTKLQALKATGTKYILLYPLIPTHTDPRLDLLRDLCVAAGFNGTLILPTTNPCLADVLPELRTTINRGDRTLLFGNFDPRSTRWPTATVDLLRDAAKGRAPLDAYLTTGSPYPFPPGDRSAPRTVRRSH